MLVINYLSIDINISILLHLNEVSGCLYDWDVLLLHSKFQSDADPDNLIANNAIWYNINNIIDFFPYGWHKN